MAQGSHDTGTGCCPRFQPEPWDDKEVEFQGRRFLRDWVWAFLHIPLNFGGIMARNMKRIQAAGAVSEENILLCDESSPWRTQINIAVSKDVPGAEMVQIPGRFLTKVFEGPYRNAPQWIKAMHSHVASKGKVPRRMYSFYTTCPRCAKAYGKNYVVLLAEV